MVWEVMLLRERHNRQTSTLMTGVVPGNVVVVVVAVCAESRGEGPGVGRGEGVGGKGVGRVVEWGGVDTTVDWVTAACTEDRLFPAAFFPPLRGTLISTSCRAMDLSQHHFLHCTATAGSYTATAGSYMCIQLLQAAIQLLLYMWWEGSAQWTMQAITSYIYTSHLLWCPWRQSTIAG